MKNTAAIAIAAALASVGPWGCDEEPGNYGETDVCEGKHDSSTGRCWQDPMAANELTWQEASDYCADLVIEANDDWRLPSRNDYLMLIDDCPADVAGGEDGYCSACIDSTDCSVLFGTDEYYYWTSTASGETDAWFFGLGDGMLDTVGKNYTRNVRCIR